MAADFGVSCGHTEYSNIRFEDGTRHMVIFEAAHDLPELETFRLELPIPYRDMPYRVRLFLTDAEYKTVRLLAAADKVRILHHANVIENAEKQNIQPNLRRKMNYDYSRNHAFYIR